MKIFGITFETKKELRGKIADLMNELDAKVEAFPLIIGQVVYDIALRNAQGKYTKTKPSFEQCTITPVTVDEKNYFKLVKRMGNNDVFTDEESAKAYLEFICK